MTLSLQPSVVVLPSSQFSDPSTTPLPQRAAGTSAVTSTSTALTMAILDNIKIKPKPRVRLKLKKSKGLLSFLKFTLFYSFNFFINFDKNCQEDNYQNENNQRPIRYKPKLQFFADCLNIFHPITQS